MPVVDPRLKPPRDQVFPSCVSASGLFHIRACLCFCWMATRSWSPPLAWLRVGSGVPYVAVCSRLQEGSPAQPSAAGRGGEVAETSVTSFANGAVWHLEPVQKFHWGDKTIKMVFHKCPKWWISQSAWDGLVALYPGCLETPWKVCCFTRDFSNTFPIFSPAKQSLQRGNEQEGQSTARVSYTAQGFVSSEL